MLGGQMLGWELTDRILAGAVEVHRALGPGLLESVYRRCLRHELESSGLKVQVEAPVPIHFKGVILESGYRADLIVDSTVLLELKSVEKLLPVHDAQVLTYLRLTKLRIGLLLNLNVTRLQYGIRRFVR